MAYRDAISPTGVDPALGEYFFQREIAPNGAHKTELHELILRSPPLSLHHHLKGDRVGKFAA